MREHTPLFALLAGITILIAGLRPAEWPKLEFDEWMALLQAFGVVSGVFAAVGIAWWQQRKEAKTREQERQLEVRSNRVWLASRMQTASREVTDAAILLIGWTGVDDMAAPQNANWERAHEATFHFMRQSDIPPEIYKSISEIESANISEGFRRAFNCKKTIESNMRNKKPWKTHDVVDISEKLLVAGDHFEKAAIDLSKPLDRQKTSFR